MQLGLDCDSVTCAAVTKRADVRVQKQAATLGLAQRQKHVYSGCTVRRESHGSTAALHGPPTGQERVRPKRVDPSAVRAAPPGTAHPEDVSVVEEARVQGAVVVGEGFLQQARIGRVHLDDAGAARLTMRASPSAIFPSPTAICHLCCWLKVQSDLPRNPHQPANDSAAHQGARGCAAIDASEELAVLDPPATTAMKHLIHGILVASIHRDGLTAPLLVFIGNLLLIVGLLEVAWGGAG